MPSYIQPSDETPLVNPNQSDADASEGEEYGTAPPPFAEARGATSPEVERILAEATEAVDSAYDAAIATVADVIIGVRDSVAGSAIATSRAVANVGKAVDKAVLSAKGQAADAGVPVVWGSGAVAAELDDVSGRPFVDAVKGASEFATQTEDVPSATTLPGSTQSGLLQETDEEALPPMGDNSPPVSTSAGSTPPPSTVPPPPPPPAAPPPPPRTTNPKLSPPPANLLPDSPPPPPSTPAADCGYYQIYSSGSGPGVTTVFPPAAVPQELLDGQCLVWFDPTSMNLWYIPVTARLSWIPPGAYYTDCGAVPPNASQVFGATECVPPPPPPPPVPPPVPPTGINCPPGSVLIGGNCYEQDIPTGTGGASGGGGSGACCPTEQLPARIAPVGTADGPGGLTAIDWDSAKSCGIADGIADGGQDDDGGKPGSLDLSQWQTWLGIGAGAARWLVPGMPDAVARALGDVGERPGRIGELGTDSAVGASLFNLARTLLPTGAGTANPAAWAMSAKLGIAARAESLIGAPLSYLYQGTTYLMQFLAPQYIPGQSGIDELYLRNKITSGYWECLTKAHGNLPTLHSKLLDAKATKPILSDIIQLRLRGIIKTDADYVTRAREVGVVDAGHATEFLQLASWIPGPADLITFMVRDAADNSVAELYGYDEEFTDKFAGPIKDWAKAQGITEDVFKYNWRAHWKIPSNTQLYSMLHRLRPDRPEVRAWEELARVEAGNPDWLKGNPRPPVVTREDVRKALQVNDVAPGWVESEIDISYHPFTNTDARRMFEIGFWDADKLLNATMDNGYRPDLAAEFVRWCEVERAKKVSVTTGVMSPRVIMNGYRAGELTRIQAFDLLQEAFPDPGVRTVQLDRATIQQQMEINKAGIAAVRKGYIYGEYDEELARVKLQQHGISLTVHDQLIARFNAAREGHKKEPRVQMLCQWYTSRLITRDQYFERLIRLGYTSGDAARIAQVCENDAILKSQQAALKAANQLKSDARSNLAELRKEIAAEEKRLKEAKKAADDAEKARDAGA